MRINTKRLKIAMATKCMNSRDLAQKAGLNFSTICSYMNGSKQPTPKSLGKVAKALGVDVTEIIED